MEHLTPAIALGQVARCQHAHRPDALPGPAPGPEPGVRRTPLGIALLSRLGPRRGLLTGGLVGLLLGGDGDLDPACPLGAGPGLDAGLGPVVDDAIAGEAVRRLGQLRLVDEGQLVLVGVVLHALGMGIDLPLLPLDVLAVAHRVAQGCDEARAAILAVLDRHMVRQDAHAALVDLNVTDVDADVLGVVELEAVGLDQDRLLLIALQGERPAGAPAPGHRPATPGPSRATR